MNKVLDLVKKLATQLEPVSGSNAQQEIWWMLEKITSKSKSQLLTQKTIDLSSAQSETLEQWLAQRVQEHKPLQYILGSVLFSGLEILVRPPILIPRPETEEMVEWVMKTFNRAFPSATPLKILDLCTGSGCIALALAHTFPNAQVVGIDIDPQAIALAQENKEHNHISNVTFIQSDLYQALKPEEKFDLIIANPPYISPQEYEALDVSVKNWEDRQALVAGQEGLAVYFAILEKASVYLKPRPQQVQIIMELGTSSEPIKQYAHRLGYLSVAIHHDMSGKPRWIAISIK